MNSRTVRVGGVFSCLSCYILLWSSDKLLDCVEGWWQLLVLYVFSMLGTYLAGLGVGWEKYPVKGILSWALIFILKLPERVFGKGKFSNIFNYRFLVKSDLMLLLNLFFCFWVWGLSGLQSTVLLGLVGGYLCRLLLEVFVGGGILCYGVSIFRFKRDKKLFQLRLSPKLVYWERVVRKVIVLSCVCLFLFIIYQWQPYRFIFK